MRRVDAAGVGEAVVGSEAGRDGHPVLLAQPPGGDKMPPKTQADDNGLGVTEVAGWRSSLTVGQTRESDVPCTSALKGD